MEDTPAKIWCGAAGAPIFVHSWRIIDIIHGGASEVPAASLWGIFLLGVSGLICAGLDGVLVLASEDVVLPLCLVGLLLRCTLGGRAPSRYL